MLPIPSEVKELHSKDELNPYLFDGDKMKDDVRLILLRAAMSFYEGDCRDAEKNLKLVGVHLTGSNASYSYTQWSDCDVHLIFDMSEVENKELVQKLLLAKKTLWNTVHENVSVKSFPIEVYPEDGAEPAHSAGVYDLVKGAWVSRPLKGSDRWDERAVATKMRDLSQRIAHLCAGGDEDEIQEMFEHLKRLRKNGLVKSGETSVENLAFKALRNNGDITRLAIARLKAQDSRMTLEGRQCEEPICETPEGGLNRCTAQTVNAFADHYHFQPIRNPNDVPEYSNQVVAALMKNHLKARGMAEVVGQTVQQFVAQHPSGTYYISTHGHAMAVINGNLVDAAQKGADSRRIISALQFRR